MKNIKCNLAILLIAITVNSCLSQKVADTTNNDLKFEKLVFHSSRCFGTCARIDLQIDNKSNMILSREFFKGKGQTDSAGTGNFSGKLGIEKYNELLQTLKASDYEKLKFPDTFCCDGSVITIIIYRDGKRTYLKSMFPPEEARGLIQYLKSLGTGTTLPKTEEQVAIEE